MLQPKMDILHFILLQERIRSEIHILKMLERFFFLYRTVLDY